VQSGRCCPTSHTPNRGTLAVWEWSLLLFSAQQPWYAGRTTEAHPGGTATLSPVSSTFRGVSLEAVRGVSSSRSAGRPGVAARWREAARGWRGSGRACWCSELRAKACRRGARLDDRHRSRVGGWAHAAACRLGTGAWLSGQRAGAAVARLGGIAPAAAELSGVWRRSRVLGYGGGRLRERGVRGAEQYIGYGRQ
jgi:hypothetical protein